MQSMHLASPSFSEGGPIPPEHACDGAGTRPELTISGQPAETVSLALVMHDPDAPSGDFVHWVAWNLPADTTAVAGNELPAAAREGQNDDGATGYFPPCPPSGTHRYIFIVYALDQLLALPAGATRAELDAAIIGHVLDQATLTGLYSRRQ